MPELPYMPLDIGKYLRDTMHLNAAQHGAYLLLIMNYWQRGKALQNNDQRLAAIARMSSDAWEENKVVLAEFFQVTETEWSHRTIDADLSRVTKKVEAHRAAGFASGEARRNKRSTDVEQTFEHISNKPGTNDEQLKEKKRNIKQDQRHSRAERPSDPRKAGFRAAIDTYAAFKHVKLPWDGSEAKALDLLLRSAPDLTLADFQTCLNHRARSPGTPHGERPRVWLPHVLKYQEAPLDQFGKTEGSNGTGNYQGKTRSSLNAAHEAIAILQQREADANRADAGEAWGETTGEAGTGRLLGSG